jgi:hypothetical protein
MTLIIIESTWILRTRATPQSVLLLDCSVLYINTRSEIWNGDDMHHTEKEKEREKKREKETSPLGSAFIDSRKIVFRG